MILELRAPQERGCSTTLKAGPCRDAARALLALLEGETPLQVVSVKCGLPREDHLEGAAKQTWRAGFVRVR